MNKTTQRQLNQYRKAREDLIGYIQTTVQPGTIVCVDCGDFAEFGKSRGSSLYRVDYVDVTFKSGGTRSYPIEFVRPITAEERKNLPKWLRE